MKSLIHSHLHWTFYVLFSNFFSSSGGSVFSVTNAGTCRGGWWWDVWYLCTLVQLCDSVQPTLTHTMTLAHCNVFIRMYGIYCSLLSLIRVMLRGGGRATGVFVQPHSNKNKTLLPLLISPTGNEGLRLSCLFLMYLHSRNKRHSSSSMHHWHQFSC